jgi:hypothetical protein
MVPALPHRSGPRGFGSALFVVLLSLGFLVQALPEAIGTAQEEQAPAARPRASKGSSSKRERMSPSLSVRSWEVSGCSLIWITQAGETETRCYNDWHWRSASALSECPGADRSGLLCYPPCKAGYDGVGPVCWQQCPAGYHDDGAFCRKDVRIIGANNDECPWYDKCGLTFSRGCSVCPSGYSNDGCTCRINADIFAKDTYTRGAGSPMSCAPGKERIGALCYGPCPPGYREDGVYCTATQQTCQQVPKAPPPGSSLQPLCFELHDPDSWVEPCRPTKVYADSEEHAEQLAQCQCTNCSVERVACSDFDGGRACH